MPASPRTARAINDRLALRLLQQEGPLTAGQLKQLTGLSRPTRRRPGRAAAGRRADRGGRGGGGAPPRPQRPAVRHRRRPRASGRPRRPHRERRASTSPTCSAQRARPRRPCRSAGDTGTGPAVEAGGGAAASGPRRRPAPTALHTVAIGAPGLVDPATGELRDSTGPARLAPALVAALQERLPGGPVLLENEVNLAALAEQRAGRRATATPSSCCGWATASGAAVVLDGTLRRGASGGTGEIGFLPVPGTARTAHRDATARAASTRWPGRAAVVRARARARGAGVRCGTSRDGRGAW